MNTFVPEKKSSFALRSMLIVIRKDFNERAEKILKY